MSPNTDGTLDATQSCVPFIFAVDPVAQYDSSDQGKFETNVRNALSHIAKTYKHTKIWFYTTKQSVQEQWVESMSNEMGLPVHVIDSSRVGDPTAFVRNNVTMLVCDQVLTRPTASPLDVEEQWPIMLVLDRGLDLTEKYMEALQNIDKYNELIGSQVTPQMMQKSISNISGLTPRLETLPDHLLDILNGYAAADALSMRFQPSWRWNLKWILALIGLAVFCFGYYSNINYDSWAIIGYLVFVAVANLVYRFAKNKRYASKYIDYRAIAEGLRVVFFWKAGGVQDEVPDFYLRRHRSDLDWVRVALRTSIHVWTAKHATLNQGKDLNLVHESWVLDQKNFFVGKVKRDLGKIESVNWWAKNFFRLGLGVAIVLAVLTLMGSTYQNLIKWACLLTPFLPVISALLDVYLDKIAAREQSTRYELSGQLFSRADEMLQQCKNSPNSSVNAVELLRELGIEALSENGDWYLLRKERPVGVPKG
ncbi:hypothetical protein JJB07_19040 [Tumebacillus sp. ITR2]|uniref:Uncharacterized protein n=1 Tax=Tumebacillus amylolyticus TaxID=2801339 RepID=A0ABS1JEM3_9BACL|nr:hypothetical protein [Tumebacillus amylolyticus]MBL0388707.1 hypothetical protein [Tumebacillus amylolyticus]